MKKDEIAALLPSVFQRTLLPGSPLDALLGIMEDLHTNPEQVLENLDIYLDPYRCPDSFVPFLASWVDLERCLSRPPQTQAALADFDFPPGLGRLRELILKAVYLSKWRGTVQGLKAFLEIATGAVGFSVEEEVRDDNGRVLPFHVRVRAPARARAYETLVRRIVEQEKPAYITCELVYEHEQAASPEPKPDPEQDIQSLVDA